MHFICLNTKQWLIHFVCLNKMQWLIHFVRLNRMKWLMHFVCLNRMKLLIHFICLNKMDWLIPFVCLDRMKWLINFVCLNTQCSCAAHVCVKKSVCIIEELQRDAVIICDDGAPACSARRVSHAARARYRDEGRGPNYFPQPPPFRKQLHLALKAQCKTGNTNMTVTCSAWPPQDTSLWQRPGRVKALCTVLRAPVVSAAKLQASSLASQLTTLT